MDPTRTILVVEDQSAERESLLRFLRSEQYTAFGAHSADAALAHLESEVDLVLSDIRLGGMNGVELLKAWKRARPETPFILMTAFGDVSMAVDAVKSGAEDYLVKPISPTALLQKMADAIRAAKQRGHRAPAQVPLEELERSAIEQTLVQCEGNRTRTAKLLGISVRTLQRKLRAWKSEEAGAVGNVAGASSGAAQFAQAEQTPHFAGASNGRVGSPT